MCLLGAVDNERKFDMLGTGIYVERGSMAVLLLFLPHYLYVLLYVEYQWLIFMLRYVF